MVDASIKEARKTPIKNKIIVLLFILWARQRPTQMVSVTFGKEKKLNCDWRYCKADGAIRRAANIKWKLIEKQSCDSKLLSSVLCISYFDWSALCLEKRPNTFDTQLNFQVRTIRETKR